MPFRRFSLSKIGEYIKNDDDKTNDDNGVDKDAADDNKIRELQNGETRH